MSKKNTVFGILFIIFTSCIVYRRWLSFAAFTYSDWVFYFKETLQELVIPTVWTSSSNVNFGTVNVLLWSFPLKVLYGLFGILGNNFNIVDKLLVFWPIVLLGPLASYLLIKKLCRSNIAALIGSFVFTYNTYFLSINTQGHVLLTAAFIIGIFAIYFYIRFLDEKRISLAFLTAISLFVTGAYDLRSLYIIFFVLFGYGIFHFVIMQKSLRKHSYHEISYALLPFFLLIFLSLYWVLPVFAAHALSGNEVLGRQVTYGEFLKIQNPLTLFYPFWTGNIPQFDTFQSIPFYFWLYPLLAILGLVLNRSNRQLIFFAFTALIGIFFAKQDNVPFPNVYYWFYNHFPGFNAFREATKFYFLIALGYSILIGSFIDWLWKYKQQNWLYIIKKPLLLVISFIFLWNTKAMVMGGMGTLYAAHTIPNNFVLLKNFVLQQPEYFRTLWIHYSTHWLIYDNNHPQLDAKNLKENGWNGLFSKETFNTKKPEGEQIITMLQDQKIRTLLNISSIKYIIIPLADEETKDYIYTSFGKYKAYYEQAMNDMQNFKKINTRAKNILVYENKMYKPHIYLTSQKESLEQQAMFQKIHASMKNPSEYSLSLQNIKNPLYLHFSDSYHPEWKIRIGKHNLMDALTIKNYYLPDSFHFQSPAIMNSFLIDPDYIKRHMNKEQYTVNQDGSLSVNVTLYFRPQIYHYLGIMVSGITLGAIMLYFIAKNIVQYVIKQ